MRKAIFAAVFMGVCTSTSLANDRDLGLYLTGNTSIGLTKDQQRHYVAGMMDAWLVDAFVSDGERFGWLLDCLKRGGGPTPTAVSAIYSDYLEANRNKLHKSGAVLFVDAMYDFCQFTYFGDSTS